MAKPKTTGLDSGVYVIHNTVSGKRYVGSSVTLGKRLKRHRYMLDTGTHPNSHLASAWAAYGADAFTFAVVLLCPRDCVLTYEQSYIDYFDAYGSGYNQRPRAANNAGYAPRAETIAKIAAANRGRVQSDAEKAKRADSCRGGRRTGETKARMAMAQTGKRMSDAARAKMSARRHSPETREKMSQKKLGRRHSPETREKMSQAHKRRAAQQLTT